MPAPSQSSTLSVAYSFDAPPEEVESSEVSEEQQLIAPRETDPARFGIRVAPTTNVRHIISHGNDGVFSNMSAKPDIGQIKEEHPPV